MAEANRDPADNRESGCGTASPDGSAWSYYDFRAWEPYEYHFAAIFRDLAQADDILGETFALTVQALSRPAPAVAIDTQGVPLPGQQDNPNTIRGFPVHMKSISLQQMTDAVTNGTVPPELFSQLSKALGRSVALHSLIGVLYGIHSDHAIAEARRCLYGVESNLPDGRGVDVGRDDHLGLARAVDSIPEPQADPNRSSDR